MKITKRLSLLSTIDHRIAAPKPKSAFIDRYLYNLRDEKQMNVQQELIKYGYTSKPRYNATRLIIAFLATGVGYFIHLYLTNIYKNEIKVRNKYRVMEQQHSSILLRLRRAVMEWALYLEKNIFLAEIILKNQTKQVVSMSEAILRTEQYRNYMKNKDRKFDFMDIGVMQKFPFPDISN